VLGGECTFQTVSRFQERFSLSEPLLWGVSGCLASYRYLKGTLILYTELGFLRKQQKGGVVSEREGENDADNKLGQLHTFAKMET
jgi:hypothetical protein